MSKLEYTAEDFVLDPEFRQWVFSPTEADKVYWEDYVRKNPYKHGDIVLARRILLNLARKSPELSEARLELAWENITKAVDQIDKESLERKTVPLNALSTIKRHDREYRSYSQHHQWYRMAAILLVAFALALSANLFKKTKEIPVLQEAVVYEEHIVPAGVKASLVLQDGSRVVLNSGSSLRYIKNFEADRRVLELEGEAYFEVAKDSLRPFMVQTGNVMTRALGTSFNIKAYAQEEMDISLLTGLVEIDLDMDQASKVKLVPGEALRVDLERQRVQKMNFVQEQPIVWTKKTILFDYTPIERIKRTLENWYGVEIYFANRPPKDLIVSGIFQDQSLENVLKGLSYSARFDYKINHDEITLTFK
jgi:transmembrane sensor